MATSSEQRRSVTVEQLTAGVLGLCVGGEKKLESDLHEVSEGLLDEVDHDTALGELFMLRVFVATYANQTFFTEAAQERIRDVFNRRLQAMLMDSEEERVRRQPNKVIDELNRVIDELNRRCQLYLEAVRRRITWARPGMSARFSPACAGMNAIPRSCWQARPPSAAPSLE